MRVRDLIQIPAKPKVTTTKRAARKVPSWHLTSEESLDYITESNKKTQEKEKKAKEEDEVKHKAVLEHQKLKRMGEKKQNNVSRSDARTKRDSWK